MSPSPRFAGFRHRRLHAVVIRAAIASLPIWGGPGCAGPARIAAAPSAPTASHDEHQYGFGWFAGSVEEAFAAARTQGKPLFLYWGAVWCPPCRALKAEVFPQPRFAERMRSFIPVYLDGDAPEAQRWAERLAVSSYPTMLVVGGDFKERMRILGAAELDEVDAALAAAAGGGAILDRVARAMSQPDSLSTQDWTLLSLISWNDPALEPEGGLAPTITALKSLAEHCPRALPEARARLSATLLALAAGDAPANDVARIKLRDEVRSHCSDYLEAWLSDDRLTLAARGPLLESASEIARLCEPDVNSPKYRALSSRLAGAARKIGSRTDVPLETRVDAIAPEVALWKDAHPKEPVPAELRELARSRVAAIMAGNIPEGLRHTVVTSAADALHSTGGDEGARALLTSELRTSKVPWYLQGDLALIAAERGERDEALKWSAEAVRSAEGRATQIQWRVAELKTMLQLRPDTSDAELLPRLRTLYDLIFSLPDGFAGRNRRRLAMVQKALGPIAARPALQSLMSEELARCQPLDTLRRAPCEAHFKALAPVTR